MIRPSNSTVGRSRNRPEPKPLQKTLKIRLQEEKQDEMSQTPPNTTGQGKRTTRLNIKTKFYALNTRTATPSNAKIKRFDADACLSVADALV